MYKDYQAEEILLTDDMKKKRLAEIEEKKLEVLEFQKQKFGVDGDLFNERKKLVKPIQEKVYKAIKLVAKAMVSESNLVMSKVVTSACPTS